MKNFDRKWQACIAQARHAPSRDTRAPFGFSTRIAALASHPNSAAEEDLWGPLVVRLLAAALPVLMLCALLEAPHLRKPRTLETGIENAVAQLVWRL